MDSTSLLDQLSGYWSALDQHPILHAGLAFGLAAIARGCLPHLKGTPG